MKKKIFRLNIGCGEHKLDGFINVDIEKKVKPDLLHDISKGPLPIKDASVELIHCVHNIEHIAFARWPLVFKDFWRVLKMGGKLYLAYPEFEKCAKNFLTNHLGQKDFWRMTLYGRQLYPGDFHVTPVVTKDLIHFLFTLGFDNIKHAPEPKESYNTFLACEKVAKPMSRVALMKKEIFKKK